MHCGSVFTRKKDNIASNLCMVPSHGFSNRVLNSSVTSHFIEFYSNRTKDSWVDYWNTGGSYLINKDFSIDLSFGADLESNISNEFVALGFSWRSI